MNPNGAGALRAAPAGPEQYPLEYVESHGVLLLEERDDQATVGACDDVAAETLAELKRFHRKPVIVQPIDRRDLTAYLERRLSGQQESPAGLTDTVAHQGDSRIEEVAHDAPAVNLVNSLLIEAIRRDASDIHIESYDDRAVIRFRVDGLLSSGGAITADQFPAVASRIKVMANLNIMERRLPQDGRISVSLNGTRFDLRVSVVPVVHGESIVLRLFQRTGSLICLDELGLDSPQVARIRRFIAAPHGLFLATGPTGSGKTTTLTAIIAELRTELRKIITIEDPVEYLLDGVNQIATNDQIGLSFDTLLRRVLRQDPDIIMVGEIRDSATAELAVRAALTGHLVLSTLHTSDALSAVLRLADMGIERYLLAGTLRSVMAQRLVRRVCGACSRPHRPDATHRKLLSRWRISCNMAREPIGCPLCGGSGYSGRIAIAELVPIDSELAEAVARGDPVSRMTTMVRGHGVRPLAEDGYRKVAAGLTTFSEVDSATEG
ncbi:MAG TPA: GspE/PulE family protein [Spirochaetia bacterium]|nr:GspE/PulE family protein [Spirochaetia bacterium]